MSKYHSKKVYADGMMFDSQREANRWCELRILERAGEIAGLQRQVRFNLIPPQKIDGKTVERGVDYYADFVYQDRDGTVVEDAKGVRTPEYVIKRKLMLYQHGIRIREV